MVDNAENVGSLIRNAEPSDLVFVGLDPNYTTADEVGGALREIINSMPEEKWPTIAFAFMGENAEPNSKVLSTFARNFVDDYVDVLASFVDELDMIESGIEMADFPGFGRTRLLAAAGYGEIIINGPCVTVRLSEIGSAMLRSIRGEGDMC